MPFAGKKLLPRDITAACAVHWENRVNLCKATATVLSESQGRIGAWNDNEREGVVLSRDCGPAQINIAAKNIGEPYEFALRTESMDPEVYLPVLANNIKAARALYDSPMMRDEKMSKRYFQPWYAYTKGWTTHPEWFVWARPDLDHWAPTGRYIHQAICAVPNYFLLIRKSMDEDQALALAKSLRQTFKVEGALAVRAKGVWWPEKPPMPTAPPADGIGPRPVVNDGR